MDSQTPKTYIIPGFKGNLKKKLSKKHLHYQWKAENLISILMGDVKNWRDPVIFKLSL